MILATETALPQAVALAETLSNGKAGITSATGRESARIRSRTVRRTAQ